ncbi:MAG: Flp family type IVb pilin [Bdellovibrionales bacterium]
MTTFKKLIAAEEGATAIEYGLIAALIAVAIVGTLALIGPKLDATFSTVEQNLPAAEEGGE